MEEKNIRKMYEIIDSIDATEQEKTKLMDLMDMGEYEEALTKIKEIQHKIERENSKKEKKPTNKSEIYDEKLIDEELEKVFLALLINEPKSISMYNFPHDECLFADDMLLDLYKSILFTDGSEYASEQTKQGFNFAKSSEELYELKSNLKRYINPKDYNFEQIYTKLKKVFILRKNYLQMPVKTIQNKIVEIIQYELYDKMTIEDVEAAIEQVIATEKFKRGVLNEELTEFFEKGENNLTTGISLPFPILTEVFKGLRKGETMSYAMPSNSGKSRFTVNLATYLAFIHKKKVLVISNEMSEEKMRLCLITTIINNEEMQELHGQKIRKTEGEILGFKFRPDDKTKVEVDKDGFIIMDKGENRERFIERLTKVSSEYNKTIKAIQWVDAQINNSIYFINITDHTNDELKKVIMNYYYKEKIEYVFYDTLKTDIANIGNGEEIKKTATILSNIAQNFNMFIASSLQLTETSTLPINLDVNDLAVSRTVKEVLDTLCLIKQIARDNYKDYEYSLKEVDTKFFDLEKSQNPDIRYYACVVDKNRAGAKPKTVFRLNLAYNEWEELGYLRLKQGANEI